MLHSVDGILLVVLRVRADYMLIDVDSFNPLISDHYLGQGILFSVLWDKGE